jgi:CRISPR-associated protein Csh2
VDLTYIKGTTVMPSGAEKKQGTFTERYILPYSLIVFYGVVNENAAKTQGIPLTEEDVDLMLDAIWNGTKNLISGSKFGQMPRLLSQIIYKENQNFHIGELDKLVSIKSEKPDEAIRDISEVKIDITELIETLTKHADKIEKIRFKCDDRAKFIKDGQDIDIKIAFSGFSLVELVF